MLCGECRLRDGKTLTEMTLKLVENAAGEEIKSVSGIVGGFLLVSF